MTRSRRSHAQTAFLYTGTHPVQTGVSAGTIKERRAAVIRGTLSDRSGQPVSGATVTIIGHPEYGQTTSRDDGEFYIAVNGGGPLTVHIEHDGFLPVDRQVDVRWQTYAFIEDTVLVRLDANVTQIDTSEPLAALRRCTAARSRATRPVERQATLMFPAGLRGRSLEMPDGSTRALHRDACARDGVHRR